MSAPLDDTYLIGLAGKTADDILNCLCQVTTMLPYSYQEVMQLLTPAKHEQLIHKKFNSHIYELLICFPFCMFLKQNICTQFSFIMYSSYIHQILYVNVHCSPESISQLITSTENDSTILYNCKPSICGC